MGAREEYCGTIHWLTNLAWWRMAYLIHPSRSLLYLGKMNLLAQRIIGSHNNTGHFIALNNGNAYNEVSLRNVLNYPSINMEKGFVQPVLTYNSRIFYAWQNFGEDSEPNHLDESEMTPRSCLDEDSELKLLTSSYETTSVQSPPQSVQLLLSQLKAERLALTQL